MAYLTARVLPDENISDAQGGVWDPPSLWSCLKIAVGDRAADFVEHCPAWRYPQGLDENLCEMYVNQDGCLPGMVNLPKAALGTFEWKRRVMVPDEFLAPPSASRSIYDIRAEYVLEFVSRGRRFGDFKATCDPGCGDAAADGFSTWFYRTKGERLYGKQLRRFIDGGPRFTPGCSVVNPGLLVLGNRLPRNFRFLTQGRSGGGRDV